MGANLKSYYWLSLVVLMALISCPIIAIGAVSQDSGLYFLILFVGLAFVLIGFFKMLFGGFEIVSPVICLIGFLTLCGWMNHYHPHGRDGMLETMGSVGVRPMSVTKDQIDTITDWHAEIYVKNNRVGLYEDGSYFPGAVNKNNDEYVEYPGYYKKADNHDGIIMAVVMSKEIGKEYGLTISGDGYDIKDIAVIYFDKEGRWAVPLNSWAKEVFTNVWKTDIFHKEFDSSGMKFGNLMRDWSDYFAHGEDWKFIEAAAREDFVDNIPLSERRETAHEWAKEKAESR